MIVQKDCIEGIFGFEVEEWCMELWLVDDPETEEFTWNVDATVDGYHSLNFESHSLTEVLDKAIEFCEKTRWYELW
jgi:hypothetical protein